MISACPCVQNFQNKNKSPPKGWTCVCMCVYTDIYTSHRQYVSSHSFEETRWRIGNASWLVCLKSMLFLKETVTLMSFTAYHQESFVLHPAQWINSEPPGVVLYLVLPNVRERGDQCGQHSRILWEILRRRTGRGQEERSISYPNSILRAHFPTAVRDEPEAIKITLLLLRSEPKQSQD